jgi:hypothetical protein
VTPTLLITIGTPPPKDIFDEAHEDVLKRLNADQFPKFMKSMFYITMYNSILLRAPYELPEEVRHVTIIIYNVRFGKSLELQQKEAMKLDGNILLKIKEF